MSSNAVRGAESAKGSRVCLVVLNEFTNDSRVLKEALSLKGAGYHVQVLALHAHGLPLQEVISGIPVQRIKLWTRGWSKWKPVQILKYVEFMLKALFQCRSFDVLHCNDLDTLPVGVLSKWMHLGRQRVVYDAHEFEIDCDGPASRGHIRAKARLEGTFIHHADAVITVSASIAKAYRRIYRIKTPALVLNCPPYREMVGSCNRFREELGIRADQKIFLYQGGLSPGRGIEKILQAFSEMPGDDVVAVFMGYGPLEQMIKFAAANTKNIYCRAAVSPLYLLDYTASADFGLVFIEKNCKSYAWCLPNKFFEYLMAGPAILCSNLVEPRVIMRQFEVGLCVTGDTLEDLKAGITQIMLMNNLIVAEEGAMARRIYCWDAQEKSLLDVYANLRIQIIEK
ncbi:glycosyltransferase [Rhodanobacter sp. DHB23]|uniref:glycosyltransferase n=1 Tax=Rhodanobacter sp. DHB23 TaxID=2775923 RepID=UPI00178649D1|nr:glycosyltransferase [Rhodanobacter sp. DHB23]MBD8872850.1 glycosyltransferase [Rhodanobacter sp. DHB23]